MPQDEGEEAGRVKVPCSPPPHLSAAPINASINSIDRNTAIRGADQQRCSLRDEKRQLLGPRLYSLDNRPHRVSKRAVPHSPVVRRVHLCSDVLEHKLQAEARPKLQLALVVDPIDLAAREQDVALVKRRVELPAHTPRTQGLRSQDQGSGVRNTSALWNLHKAQLLAELRAVVGDGAPAVGEGGGGSERVALELGGGDGGMLVGKEEEAHRHVAALRLAVVVLHDPARLDNKRDLAPALKPNLGHGRMSGQFRGMALRAYVGRQRGSQAGPSAQSSSEGAVSSTQSLSLVPAQHVSAPNIVKADRRDGTCFDDVFEVVDVSDLRRRCHPLGHGSHCQRPASLCKRVEREWSPPDAASGLS
eukprot:822961-Rhodomonas_salina.8